MSDTVDNVKARIRKLLNLAENDAATEGEVANAVAFAQRLMAEHHLSEHEVRQDCQPNAHAVMADLEKLAMLQMAAYGQGEKLASWERTLGSFVAKLIGSVGVYLNGTVRVRTAAGTLLYDSKGQPVERGSVKFYGEAEEVRLACQLYTDLGLTIAAMARLQFGGVFRGEGRSYADGFVAGLYTKLSTAEKLAAGDNKALALRCTAIVQAKKQHAAAWLKGQGVKLGSASRSGGREHHRGAYEQGKQDGAAQGVSVTRRGKLATAGEQRQLPGR
jgi:hypothetical protein